MDLPFERLHPDAELPSAAHAGDAGLDLRSTVDLDVAPGERGMIPTGLAVAIPEGHAGLVLPRSGLASKHGLTLANSPGLIDAGYRGEIVCAVVNLDRERAGADREGRSDRAAGDRGDPGGEADLGRAAAAVTPRHGRVRLHGHRMIQGFGIPVEG